MGDPVSIIASVISIAGEAMSTHQALSDMVNDIRSLHRRLLRFLERWNPSILLFVHFMDNATYRSNTPSLLAANRRLHSQYAIPHVVRHQHEP